MQALQRLIVFSCVLLHLFGGIRAGLFLSRNGYIYCKWSSRGLCDKFGSRCVQYMDGTMNYCKHYKNECQFLIDQCLSRTEFGRQGAPVAFSPGCKNIGLNQMGVCGT
ncbi:uncharacterized protein LOC108658017 [Drosophila navojoa]|uniref:uncharacterized protein LOC108658017 n=1 Tax=Drosophila navojoa TaxID=7232 RepID=UPI0008470991|nr:uncharacterized protein LOC108658017 [Drosophila navojoa]